MNLQAMSKLP